MATPPPIVDCVVGGSPCQDLSVAGKRAGLDGERSGLFMEQIRIIKEMREQDVRNGRTDESIRPRYMVWENVPGAFSSNKGEDFRIVLEETAKVADKDAVIPMPDKGKWQTSGCIMGDGWSIAWRVLDAQFWGVPQRRRRIALVADFGGHSASQILFVPQSVSRHPQPSQPQRKATPADATRGIGADDSLGADQYNAVVLGDTVSTLGVNCGMSHGRQCVLDPVYSIEPGIASREGGHIYENVSGTLRANAGDNQMSAAYTMKIRSGCDIDSSGKPAGKGALIQTEKSGTLSCVQDQYLFQPVYSVENHPADSRVDIDDSGKVQTLTSRMGTGGGNVPMVMESTECVIALDRASYNQGKNAQFDIGINENGTAQSLVAKGPGAVCYGIDQQGGKGGANYSVDVMPTICSDSHGTPHAVCYSFDPLSSNSMKSSNPHSGCHQTDVARTIDTTNPDPSKNQGGVAIVEQVYTIGNGQVDQTDLHEKAGTLNCMHDQQAVMIAETCGINGDVAGTLDSSYYKGCGMRQGVERDVVAVDCRNGIEADVNATLQMGAFRSLNCNNVVRTRYTVRRLTPLECERLQGYPDGWTDIGYYTDSSGKTKHSSDAARYKALGNSIALPPWKWVMKRLCACYERDATLASLFDGIGGFPYIWEQINGKGSCLWASEIEEFPIAVTKVRIGE